MYRVCPRCRDASGARSCTCHLILPVTRLNSKDVYPWLFKERADEVAAWVKGLKEGDQVALLTEIKEDGNGNQSFDTEIATVKRIIPEGTLVFIDGYEVEAPVYHIDNLLFDIYGQQIKKGHFLSKERAQIRLATEWHRNRAERAYLKQELTEVGWDYLTLNRLRSAAEVLDIKPFHGRVVPQEEREEANP